MCIWQCIQLDFLLTYAGDYDMQKCDSKSIVPNPPPHHCSKQKATTKVGELKGQEVHWEIQVKRENTQSLLSSQSRLMVTLYVLHGLTQVFWVGLSRFSPKVKWNQSIKVAQPKQETQRFLNSCVIYTWKPVSQGCQAEGPWAKSGPRERMQKPSYF